MSHLIVLAVPLLVFLGALIEMAGRARTMISFRVSLIGHLRGGLQYLLLGAMCIGSDISGAKSSFQVPLVRSPPRVKLHAVGMAKLFLALSHSTTGVLEIEAVTCGTTSSRQPRHARCVTVGGEVPRTAAMQHTDLQVRRSLFQRQVLVDISLLESRPDRILALRRGRHVSCLLDLRIECLVLLRQLGLALIRRDTDRLMIGSVRKLRLRARSGGKR